MNNINDYVFREQSAALKGLLRQQWHEATNGQIITCVCGKRRELFAMYRCLYCGLYLCVRCAEDHFGKTIEQWVVNKRIETRLVLEQNNDNTRLQRA